MKTKELTLDEKNEMFKQDIKNCVIDYLTKINRLQDYDVDRITNDLNKLKTLDTISYEGVVSRPIDYVLNYFERIPKKIIKNY